MDMKDHHPKRLIAVGDIHGQLEMLNRLLVRVDPQPEDQVVFLGDYIDRGMDSRGVIERLITFKSVFPQTVFIRGNHDQLLLDSLVEAGLRSGARLRELSDNFRRHAMMTDHDIFLGNGGQNTLDSYQLDGLSGFPPSHVEFLEQTIFYWSFDRFVFVHAGIAPGVALDRQDPYTLLWDRLSPPGRNGIIHVIGHNPTGGKPRLEPGCYQLDTGAGYGRALTACDVFTLKVWQIG